MTDETADAEEGVPTPDEPLGDDDALLDEPDEEVEGPDEADAGGVSTAPSGQPPSGRAGYPPQPLPEDIDITNEPA